MTIDCTFLKAGELRYGHVLGVDIERFSTLGMLEQRAAQATLAHVLNHAAAAADLPRSTWCILHKGDGELAILPSDVDAAWMVSIFTDQLAQELLRLRSDTDAQPKIRLRVSMHHGTLTVGELGPIGPALIDACRLLDAPLTKAALAADPSSDLVLVVSEQLYQEVVTTRFHGLAPDRFRPIQEEIKGATYAWYLCQGSPKRAIDS